jgi:DNA-binding MurR/RpiR family transcriptional regulator
MTLPLGERRLAERILEMRVSKATAARLVRRLGYADFRTLLDALRATFRGPHGGDMTDERVRNGASRT